MNRRNAVLFLGAIPGLASLWAGDTPQAKDLSTEELEKLLEKRQNLFFLDVREPEEIKQLGSVEGYVNIPLGQLESRLGEIPKNKLIITL